jgi:hypothetical protein
LPGASARRNLIGPPDQGDATETGHGGDEDEAVDGIHREQLGEQQGENAGC